MTIEIQIPKLAVSMIEGTITEWVAKDGDQVAEGDVLYVLETEKVEQEIESPASGKLCCIGEPGETYPIGFVVGRIE